ncbi:MAG: helix-turn-helix domain-containing protein [Alphaproteobacteria bacterium]|nr:helix-turn-helix domain-containing protein [Alphaproteobacteria bacterium]
MDVQSIDKLPSSIFTTAAARPSDQFEAWRQSISVLFDVETRAEDRAADGFHASVRAWHLGDLLVSRVEFDGQLFSRDRRRIALDGLDHYLVQLYERGGLVGTLGERDHVLRAGEVQILDLTRPNLTRAGVSATVSIVVSRDAMHRVLPRSASGLHGMVLRDDGGVGALLADYMRSLAARVDGIERADGALVARATVELVAACIQSTAEATERARPPLEAAILDRLQRYIERHLGSPDLHADALSGQFKISRSRLYRLFEPLGGVANYIQEQRLWRAYGELAKPGEHHRRIYEIAFEFGFSSEAHFSRAFRSAFGLSPSDVRQRAVAAPVAAAAATTATEGYEDWLRRLGSAGDGT